MKVLFKWLNESGSHPLVKSCVFHYEFEFIHPFLDGNGRTGRYWQTAILGKWRDAFYAAPIENIVLGEPKRLLPLHTALNASGQFGTVHRLHA